MGFATVSVFPLGDTPALLSTRLHHAGLLMSVLFAPLDVHPSNYGRKSLDENGVISCHTWKHTT